MSDIPIAIVDENNVVVGSASIDEARKRGLIRRVARVMIENPQGELLLQKRTAKMLFPNCWDNSAAGHVDAGEDYIVAAKRELFEEVGMLADELEEIGNYYSDSVQGDMILKGFNRVYKIVTDEAPTEVQNDEVAEVKWFTLEEVKKLIKQHPDKVTDGLVDVMQRYY